MLLSNIGGKYLALDIKNIDILFENYAILRYLILFSVFFNIVLRPYKMTFSITYIILFYYN